MELTYIPKMFEAVQANNKLKQSQSFQKNNPYVIQMFINTETDI